MINRIIPMGLLVGSMISAGIALASPAWSVESEDSSAAACWLDAERPVPVGSTQMTGRAFRGTACPPAVYKVKIFMDVSLRPDPQVGQQDHSPAQNGWYTSWGSCHERNGQYYTRGETSAGNSVESARKSICPTS